MKRLICAMLVLVLFAGVFAYAAGGDMIVETDMSLGAGLSIDGNVYVTYGSTLSITGPFSIGGNLYIWGTVNNMGDLNVSGTIYCLHYNNMMHASMDYKCGYLYNYGTLKANSLNVTDSWINTKIPGASSTATIPPLPTATPAPSKAPITNDSWSFENGVLTIKIEGDMPDYNFSSIPWLSAQRTATKIIIEEGATRIGECAFYDFWQVSEIELPTTLKSIGIWAFYGCSNLDKVTIPDGVTKVESWAFSDCMKLKDVSMPDSITNMGLGVFDGSNSVTITVPKSANYVINYCNSYGITIKMLCDAHAEVVDKGYAPSCTTAGLSDGRHCSACGEVLAKQEIIPASGHMPIIDSGIPATHITPGLTDGSHCEVCGMVIAEQVEIQVVDVQKIILPNSIKIIGEEAFLNSGIHCVIIPDGCETIMKDAFKGSNNLVFAEIPRSVNHIDETAFDGCNSELVIVTEAGSVAEEYAYENGIECVIK